jgi:L-2-hydroxyglutarate oxidase LhgO
LDVVVIGAGIIGSWVALALARAGLSVAVFDASNKPGDGISGRNSGVLHAGIYYDPGSLKAIHCQRGRNLTEEFLQKHRVPFTICGKLVVGEKDDEPRLITLLENAKRCGAEGLSIISQPGRNYIGVRGSRALHSSKTGVVDAPAYLSAVRAQAEANGALFLLGRTVTEIDHGRIVTRLMRTAHHEEITCDWIVNAAGLDSDTVAGWAGVSGYEIRPNRGEYFRLRKQLPYPKLVYPLPLLDSTALGVHYTFHLNGDAYAGPNSIWAENKKDYRITASRREFYLSLSRILEGYEEADLEPGYAGLRPRLFINGIPQRDFVILENPDRVIHMLGIESPGLTSAPSLAEAIAARVTRGEKIHPNS